MYFESHAHYDDKQFNEDRDLLLSDFKNKGISTVVNIGIDIKSSKKSIEFAEKYDFVYATIGVHPHNAKEIKQGDYLILENLLKHKKVVAVGEVGLDFHYDLSPRDVQLDVFKKHLKLSEASGLPVVIHSREASQMVFDTIKKSNVRKGVIHAYSGSLEMAREYIKMGYYIGVGGVITFKNAKSLVEVVEGIGLENILIETDSPYLTPVPFRGKRNNSEYLKYVVEKIAEIKNVSQEEVCVATTQNARCLFNI
ncbi:MAG: TatD family hydrolase [bacterium]